MHLTTCLAAHVIRQDVRPPCDACAGGYITLKDGQTLEYDWLVLALGAETASFGIPGVRELALPFCTYNDAVRVRSAAAKSALGISSVCSLRSGTAGMSQDNIHGCGDAEVI